MPEFEFAFSFESGLESWVPASGDLGAGSASAAGSSEMASQGSRSASVRLENPDGAGKVWMTRELEVTPEQSYTVELTFDIATADHGVVDPWTLIVGIADTAPDTPAALAFGGDTSSGAETASGVVWAEKSATLSAKADEEGRLFVTLGVWGTTAGTRAYWIDNVRVVLTRS